MAFTMHSHSGQFCPSHAKDDLEPVIQHAIGLGLHTMGLTEHMPRKKLSELYDDEMHDPEGVLASLMPRHEAYLAEAKRLQAKYAEQIELLIGFEGEWFHDEYAEDVLTLFEADLAIDYFIGSVHHCLGQAIDFSPQHYRRAVLLGLEAQRREDRESGVISTSEEILAKAQEAPALTHDEVDVGERYMYRSYYDAQYAMLTKLRPRIVGHFDLIRLFSQHADDRAIREVWPEVWERMERNLQFIVSYGGMLEANTSALRKGLAEPYPARPVAETYLSLGGQFTFSDDSHGTAQLTTNYHRGLDYLESLGVSSVWTFSRKKTSASEPVRASLETIPITLAEFRQTLKVPRDELYYGVQTQA